MQKNIFTIDFETTGKDPKECEPVEFAIHNAYVEAEWLIKPTKPIPPETSAIHHITDEDVAQAAEWLVIRDGIIGILASVAPVIPVLVAHNAQYEQTILLRPDLNSDPFPPVVWVCTYKCALRVWPDAPAFSNESLRYWLKLGERGRSVSQRTHSALHDTKVTYLLLQELLKHATLEQLVQWTELPAKLPRMPMGKHFGQTWDTVPGPYLQWCLAQADMREDVKYCAKEELDRRKGR